MRKRLATRQTPIKHSLIQPTFPTELELTYYIQTTILNKQKLILFKSRPRATAQSYEPVMDGGRDGIRTRDPELSPLSLLGGLHQHVLLFVPYPG